MQNIRPIILLVSLCGLIAITLVGGEKKFPSKAFVAAGEITNAIKKESSKNYRPSPARSIQSSFGDSYLVDSIITIVQNYYVDESRVESRALLESTLKSLSRRGYLDSVEGDFPALHLTKSGFTLDLVMASPYSSDDLIKDSSAISNFIEKYSNPQKTKRKQNGSYIYLESMLASLDPHSNLLDQDEYQDLRQGTDGSFGGLGIVVGMKDDVLTVVKPLPRSPAARAGLSRSDRIIKIDGRSTFGSTLDDLIQYMRGEPGTKVALSILSEGGKNPKTVSLVREVVRVDSVESKLIRSEKSSIIYASIESFSSKTASELKDALIKEGSKEKISGLILDLRSNPGGLLDQAVKVADLFLDEGKIVSTVGRTRDSEFARKNIVSFNYPIVVLTNSDTASASEIVAGALRDHNRALVIGEPTFGKGSVQTVFELPGEMALKLTIARYFTPSGTSIQNTGIMPDVWIQAVNTASTDKNNNLLGEYRYKGERFLDHSLEAYPVANQAQIKQVRPVFYLKDMSADHAADVPLDFSIGLLKDLAALEGIPMPLGRLRSTYWKASLFPKTGQILDKMESEVEAYLRNEYHVEWSSEEVQGGVKNENIELRVNIPQKFIVRQKNSITIPWQVENKGKHSAYQISVFATSTRSNIATSEILIGKIDSGEIKEGVLTLAVGPKLEQSPISLNVGLAVAGMPLEQSSKEVLVEVKKEKIPEISTNLRYVDGPKGLEDGIIEPGEKGFLEFQIVNNSKMSIEDFDLKISNLSGHQFGLNTDKVRIKSLAPGDSRTVRIGVEASSDVVSSSLEVGVRYVFDNYTQQKRARFVVPSKPSPVYSRNLEMDGVVRWKEN